LHVGASGMKRMVVFIDAQNFYRNARRAFFDDASDPYQWGQYRPWAVGELLARRDPDRELASVRLYTGRPDANLQPKAHAANVRQCLAWEAAGCYVFHRPLRYPFGWPNAGTGQRPEEKGIDVALALDIVRLAQDGAYDVGVICSGDTDLIPAVEDVVDHHSDVTIEVAAWRSQHHRQRLSLASRKIWCHWLGLEDFNNLRDDNDYARPT